MAQTWDNLLAFLRDHGDVLTAGLALIVLAEAAAIYLWARRARELRARAEESLRSAERAQLEVARIQGELARLEESSRQPGARGGLYRVRGSETEAAQPPPAEPLGGVPTPASPMSAPVADAAGEAVPRALVFPGDEVAADPPTLRAASWAASMESATASLTNGSPEAPSAGGGSSLSWAALLGSPPAEAEVAPADPPTSDSPSPPAAPAQPTPSTPAGWGQLPADAAATATETTPAQPAAPPPPAWPPSPTSGAAPAAPADAPAADGQTAGDVLLVEDDDNVARLYRTLLEGRGFSLRHAEDGIAGLEEVHRRRPALILLDMMMPRMNGITFLQTMREDPTLADVPVVVLSNFREERLVERATALGALEYLVKAQTRPMALVDAIPHWMRGVRVG